MGFRNGSFCTVWETELVSNTMTKCRISISRKDKMTDEYVQDFSGYIAFVGTACAQKAARLKPRDRIRLGDVDVSTTYNKERNTTYTNFKVFSFESPEEINGAAPSAPQQTQAAPPSQSFLDIDDGMVDDELLPF